jgi:flagellar hook capping protein FlgD
VIVTSPTPNLSIDLPPSITFVAGETHNDYFGPYITNNTGNTITMSSSGNTNVSVSIHHGTDVDFTCPSTWSGTETITFTVTDGIESASDDIDVIVTSPTPNLSIDLPPSITFVAGETHNDYFGPYITNNTGNTITMSSSGNTNVSVSIHHGTDVDFTCPSTWSGTETITFTVTDGIESASDDIDVIVTSPTPNLLIELPDTIEFEHFTTIDVDFTPFITNNTGNDITLSYSGNVYIQITLLDNFIVHFEGVGLWIGTETITFSITDDRGREVASDNVDVTVTPEPGEITINLPDEITMITNTVREEDLSIYISSVFSYTITCEPTDYINVEFNNMGHAIFSVIEPGWVGTENIVFIVTDFFGLVETDDMDVVVLPEAGMSLTLPSTFMFEVDQTAIRNLSGFTDEEDVTFTVEGNQNINFSFSNQDLTMTTSPGWTGEETVTIIAESSTGGQAFDDVTVIVHPVFDNSAAYKGESYDGFDFAFGYLIESFTLSGVVVDVNTAERIPAAIVTVGELETIANDVGEYEIDVEFGVYDIECSATDYETFIVEDFAIEEDVVLNFQLTPNVSSDNILNLSTLLQTNMPNPFNPETTIFYSLEETSEVSLEIYNVKGQKVKQLVNSQIAAGQHSIIWDGKDDAGQSVASGVFFYKMTVGDYSSVKKMMLLK